MSSKIIAVIPTHGRHPLLRVTISRLVNQGVGVICVGSDFDQDVCENAGADFYYHSNKPLGKKWNYGFLIAKNYKPDFVLYVGSSDWISDNWLPVLLPLAKDVDIVGKPDYNLLHITSQLSGNLYTLANWPGYPLGTGREYEPIGGGRILNAHWLDKIGWKPFDDYLNMSMDYSMYGKLNGGKCLLFNSPEIQLLALSCNKWSNMHESDFKSNVIMFREPELWLQRWFPDALKLEL